jgi:hypothetical protein
MPRLADEMRRNAVWQGVLLLALACLAACSDPQTTQPDEPVAVDDTAAAAATAGPGDGAGAVQAPAKPGAAVADRREEPGLEIRSETAAPVLPAAETASVPEFSATATASAAQTAAADEGENAGSATAVPESRALDSYKVRLGVDAQLKLPGSPGELIVWIGDPRYEAQLQPGMDSDETMVPALGETAEVEVFAPDFDYKPAEPQCIRIHPRGSAVRFSLWPREAGTFEVGADVRLYESADCSGTPVPRSLANLNVKVVVDSGKLVERGAGELLQVAWEKFLEFWGYLLAAIFGLLLFLFKGRLAKLFGYQSRE